MPNPQKDWAAEAAKFGGTVANAPAEAHIGPATPMTALPDTAEGRAIAVGGPPLLPKSTRDALTTPLAHPTGIDLIDSLTSPVNLALTAVMEAPAAAKLFSGAVTGLTEKVGSPLAAKLLKFVIPSALKKPAALADILMEFGKLGEKPAVAAHTPAPASAPVASAPASAPVVAAPAATAPASFTLGKAMDEAKSVFSSIKVAPLSAEVGNAAEMMRAGVPASEAVARVIAKRPGVDADAVAALAKKLGTPSDATVGARVAERNATGRWSN